MTTRKNEIPVTVATPTLRRLIAMKSKVGLNISSCQIVLAAISRFSWIVDATESKTPDALVEHESAEGLSFDTDIPVFELEDDSDYEGQFVILVSESEEAKINAALVVARAVTGTEVSKIGFIRACLRNFLSAFGNEQRGFKSTLRLANDNTFRKSMPSCIEFIVGSSTDDVDATVSANADELKLIELLRDHLCNNYIQPANEAEILIVFARVHPVQEAKMGASYSLLKILDFCMEEYPEFCIEETV